jgi:glycosyltransferase involved in cell wall biosynthesis
VVYTPKGNLAWAEFKRLRDVKKFPYLLTLELGLLSISDRIIFSSELEKRYSLATSAFARKSAVVPEPFVGPGLQPARSRPAGATRFGFLAEIAPRKGLAELIEAFITWQSGGELAAELHVAGEPRPGSERYYEAVRNRAGMAPRPETIIFHGPLRGSERDDFYENIDFFVCPTRFESFGLTPLEALWHGKPVMVTENLGVLEFISDLECIVSLGQGRPGEILTALGAAMAARDRYLEAAKHWRMRTHPRLADRQLALDFSRELGVERTPREAESWA